MTLENKKPINDLNQISFHLGYQPSLDGIRGFAVLAVMAFHYGVPAAKHGFVGVDAFFVLSGFLITSILMEEWRTTYKINLSQFYIRRILRLFPALWLMLIVISPLVPKIYTLSTIGYVTNWVMALHLSPLVEIIGHLWSLSIEEQFYLLWPIILLFFLPRFGRHIIYIALLLAVASAIWRATLWIINPDWIRIYCGTDTHIDGLLMGSALALIAAFGLLPKFEKIKYPFLFATLIAIFFIVYLIASPALPLSFFAIFGDFGAALVTAILVIGLVLYPIPILRRFLEFKPLTFIGTISYGLYLWHVPVAQWLFSYLGYPSNAPLIVLVEFVLTFVVAIISYRYIKQPILRLKNRLQPKHVPLSIT